MKYRFVLGIGRSGTTLLSRLMSFSRSPLRFVIEPLPRVNNFLENDFAERWFVPPDPFSAQYSWAQKNIAALATGNESIRAELVAETVERDDEFAQFLLIKEVHGLLAFHTMLSELDAKCVVITRAPTRIVDSYFRGHTKKQRKYLVDEYNYLKQCLSNKPITWPNESLATAVAHTSLKVIKYLKRPPWLTNEVLRYACIVDFITRYLIAWSESDDRVHHIAYRDLCCEPIAVCQAAYEFLDLQYDAVTMAEIEKMTRGSSTEYYSTYKSSKQILNQDYKYLSNEQVQNIHNLVA